MVRIPISGRSAPLFLATLVVTVGALELTESVVGGTRLTTRSAQAEAEKATVRDVITEIPEISSKVDGVSLADVKIVRTGTYPSGQPVRVLRVTIKNDTNSPIIAYYLRIGNRAFSGADGQDGDSNTSEPIPLVEAFGTTEHVISTANFKEGDPLVLSAVHFADGSMIGEAKGVKRILDLREQSRSKELIWDSGRPSEETPVQP